MVRLGSSTVIMKFGFVLLVLLIGALFGVTHAFPSKPLIARGVPAIRGEFPYIVRIKYLGLGTHCDGTLIDSEWIVTAAHCTLLPTGGYSVVAGEYQLDKDDGSEQIRTVSNIITHPRFNSNTLANDIAVMKLSSPVTIDSNVKAVQLAGLSLPYHQDLTVVGWGGLNESEGSNVLLKATFPRASSENCNSVHGDSSRFVDSIFCTAIPKTDPCVGESGGPLVNKFNELVGVVSWGIGCGAPGIYIDMIQVKGWILASGNA